ncbi:hypothetical protein IE53DRAFT_251896 [Violaceomyces palustris]|uniref:Uncharacterized protein n=1 Tax=Violaceomyces palustris TaxID=1673888 RepID=A0ACD0P3U3_9BASI|nr:hypothetical protein IE53DRAFT_251896 [Violaceomyces palustris]
MDDGEQGGKLEVVMDVQKREGRGVALKGGRGGKAQGGRRGGEGFAGTDLSRSALFLPQRFQGWSSAYMLLPNVATVVWTLFVCSLRLVALHTV